MSGAVLALGLVIGVAHAESARPLDASGRVVYGGLGVGTFQYGSSGLIRDRQVRARFDTFAARGLGGGWELRGGVPVTQALVLEDPDRGPCPGEGDYCAPTTGLGEAWIGVRRGVVDRGLQILVEADAFSDAWNAGARGRWTNIGQGTGGGAAALVLGAEAEAGAWRLGTVGIARFRLVLGRPVAGADVRLPGDEFTGGVELWAARGRWRPELSLGAMGRLGGLAYGAAWVENFRPLDDRWAALRYREVSTRAGLSVDLGDGAGLHVSAGRVLLAWSGPQDASDLSVGLHRYWAARRP